MSSSIHEALRKLGLRGYDIKVYMVLLKYGPLTAYEISSSSGVPYPKVYSSVDRLRSLGLVEETETRPLRFKVKPPSPSLEKLKNQIIQDLERSVDLLVREFAPLYSAVSKMEQYGRVNIIGLSRVVRGMLRMISETTEELLITLPFTRRIPATRLLNRISSVSKKRVHVKLITWNGDEKLMNIIKGLDNVEHRVVETGNYMPFLAVSDNKIAMMANRFLAEDGFEYWIGVISSCENCIKNVTEIFQSLWDGKPISIDFERRCLTMEEFNALAKYLKGWPSLKALGLK